MNKNKLKFYKEKIHLEKK